MKKYSTRPRSPFLLCVTLFLVLFSSASHAVKLKKIPLKGWIEAKSENVHLITDAKPELAKQMVKDIEEFRYFIPLYFGTHLLKGVPPVKILGINKRSNFKRLDFDKKWAGVFLHRFQGAYVVANLSEYKIGSSKTSRGKHVLMHEYVHYAMRHMLTQSIYPLWYREGIAEYLGTFMHTGKMIKVGSLDTSIWGLVRINRDIREGVFDVETLFKKTRMTDEVKKETRETERKEGDDILDFYSHAYGVVHYLHSNRERRNSLDAYIERLNKGDDIDTAFKTAFKMSFADLTAEVSQYFRKGQFFALTFSSVEGKLKLPKVDVEVRKLKGSEFFYHLTEVLVNLSDYWVPDKWDLIHHAMKLDPGNPNLEVILADYESYYDAESAKARVEEVLDSNPKHPHANVVLGEILEKEAKLHRKIGMSEWEALQKKAKKHYRQAILSKEYYGRAYFNLGLTYLRNPTVSKYEEGALSLEMAQLLGPSYDAFRLFYDRYKLYLKSDDMKNAALSLRRYIQTQDSSWVKHDGLYFLHSIDYPLIYEETFEKTDKGARYGTLAEYVGELSDGLPHGKGVLTKTDGTIYRGTFKAGLLEGEGELITSHNYHYQGSFKDGYITGPGKLKKAMKKGVEIWEGEFEKSFAQGKQVITYENGDVVHQSFWWGRETGERKRIKAEGETEIATIRWGGMEHQLADGTFYVGSYNISDAKKVYYGTCYNDETKSPFKCRIRNRELLQPDSLLLECEKEDGKSNDDCYFIKQAEKLKQDFAALNSDNKMGNSITVRAVITPKGKISQVDTKHTDISSRSFVKKYLANIKKTRLPKRDKTRRMHFKYVFDVDQVSN